MRSLWTVIGWARAIDLRQRKLAWPTTVYEAEMVVTGWLKDDAQQLGTALGQTVMRVETFTDAHGEPQMITVRKCFARSR